MCRAPNPSMSALGLVKGKPSGDGRSQVFPAEHALKIWRVSWLCLVSFFMALACRTFHLAPMPFLVWATSLNYWRRPGPGLRRVLDISCVHVSAAVCMWNAFAMRAEWLVGYWFFTGAGIASYYTGCCLGGRVKAAVRCHIALHVLANVGNWCLFVGSQPHMLAGLSPPSRLRVYFLAAGCTLAALYNAAPPSAAKHVLYSAPGVIAGVCFLRLIAPEFF